MKDVFTFCIVTISSFACVKNEVSVLEKTRVINDFFCSGYSSNEFHSFCFLTYNYHKY